MKILNFLFRKMKSYVDLPLYKWIETQIFIEHGYYEQGHCKFYATKNYVEFYIDTLFHSDNPDYRIRKLIIPRDRVLNNKNGNITIDKICDKDYKRYNDWHK